MWTILLKGNTKGRRKWPSRGMDNDNGRKSNAYIRMLLKASDLAQGGSFKYKTLFVLNDNEHWDGVHFLLFHFTFLGATPCSYIFNIFP